MLTIAAQYRLVRHIKFLLLVSVICALVSCRGGDNQGTIDPELLDFIETTDPNRFNLFLNTDLGTKDTSVGNAYYNSVDPENTRTNLESWQIANGFTTGDDSFGNCSAPSCCIVDNNSPIPSNQCEVVMTRVRFRDVRDQGYGRDMYMRHDRVDGDIAVFVRNFVVDDAQGLPEGVPYGPLNLEALIQNHSDSQFSVSAIEYSAFPADSGQKFAKFYTFEGLSEVENQGERREQIDITFRGFEVEMPNACSTCHGGRGRSTVDAEGNLMPALHNGIAGDVQAHLQSIDVDSLQFASELIFSREAQEGAFRAINNAVLHSYYQTRNNLPVGSSAYWDPDAAIDLLQGRYDVGSNCELNGSPFDCVAGTYTSNYTPPEWSTVNPVVFNNLIAPNCLGCHILRGTVVNPGVSFHTPESFIDYASATDDLVFATGLMPSGLWNYREFWDLKNPLPLAEMLNLEHRMDEDSNAVVLPGRPVAKISAAPAAKLGSVISVNASGSVFADSYTWVIPESAASIASVDSPDQSRIQIQIVDELPEDSFEISVRASSVEFDCSTVGEDECSDTVTIEIDAEEVESPITFFNNNDQASVAVALRDNCSACHGDTLVDPDTGELPFPGLPVLFCSSDLTSEQIYESVLTRVNLNSPTDSLLLRKGTNGADVFDSEGRSDSEIRNYHFGGAILDTSNIALLINWINSGAESGDIPDALFACQ